MSEPRTRATGGGAGTDTTSATGVGGARGAAEVAGSKPQRVVVRVRRQADPRSDPYWDEFEVPYRPNMNVIVLLSEIRKDPVNRKGETVTPVAWDANCLEEVCGACSMVINGRPRQSCTALVDHLDHPIVLEPMNVFPVVRDLVIDRQKMFDDLKRMRAWIPIDGTYDLGPGPRVDPEVQEKAYKLSTCFTCGCCLQACPQVNPVNPFIGAAIVNQVRLFGLHPTGRMHQPERLDAVSGPGGIQECGNAQNCVKVCPKEIPLTESLGAVQRQLTARKIFGMLRR
ncbi:MAG: succinate dehydrogenase iron-sulfur subunit [Candidatus Eisenbacteria bacterium]|nr:succinate dehydrogenase iron-sulfur subunit [Candidatus Eisenbacteria bacterium]